MTAADYRDFTQPVAQIDQATQIGQGSMVLHNGQSTSDFDVSTYASLSITITPPASTAGHRYLLILRWKEAGNVVDVDTVSFHSDASYSSVGFNEIYRHLPVRGSSFNLSVIGDDASDVSMIVTASTRELAGGRASLGNDVNGRLIASYSAIIPATSNSGPIYVPPVAELLAVTWTYVIAAGVITLDGVNASAGAAIATHLERLTFGAASVAETVFRVSHVGTELVVINNDAAPHSGTVQVWDVSP